MSPLNTLASSVHSMHSSQGPVQAQRAPYLGPRICRNHPPPAHCRRADGGHEADCARSCSGSTRAPSCTWGPSHRSHSCSRTCGAGKVVSEFPVSLGVAVASGAWLGLSCSPPVRSPLLPCVTSSLRTPCPYKPSHCQQSTSLEKSNLLFVCL